MIPTQKHKAAKGGKKCATDKSKAHISDARGAKASPDGAGSKATRPRGTPISGPGGRKSRANTYE